MVTDGNRRGSGQIKRNPNSKAGKWFLIKYFRRRRMEGWMIQSSSSQQTFTISFEFQIIRTLRPIPSYNVYRSVNYRRWDLDVNRTPWLTAVVFSGTVFGYQLSFIMWYAVFSRIKYMVILRCLWYTLWYSAS